MIKIGELSKICNVPIKTIRFYEEEKLISPAEVDRWTGYRYYDENSIKRLSEIIFLKNLGFQLKEIRNFDDEEIRKKTKNLMQDLEKIKNNIHIIRSLRKNNKGEYEMKTFINDENAIGKWKKLGIVSSVSDKEIKEDKEIFPFGELYLMPNGAQYWVVSWTKGFVYIKDRKNPYQIIGDKMYIGVVDCYNDAIEDYAVYEKVDSKRYTSEDIRIKDNVDLPFVNDEQAVGFWEAVNYTRNPESFSVDEEKPFDLFLTRYSFAPNGEAMISYSNGETDTIAWTKGLVLNQFWETASEYQIKDINGEKYMFVEWKSGDYTFGGRVTGYYVLKKI